MGGTKGRAVARLSPDANVKEGEHGKLALDPTQIHLFDPSTGKALRA